MVAYLFGCELKDSATGLVAAAFMALVPGYMSRSVAGSFDNEAVAIFALVTTFYLWVRAVNQGTVASAVACAFAYLYMAASWGAYVFISNLIPLYVILMVAINRYTKRLYIAYTTLWAVRFIGFNHIVSTELLAWNAVFLGLQAWELVLFVRTKLGARMFERLLWLGASGLISAGAAVLSLLLLSGKLNPWTGRFWTLLDPTYAKKFIPIVASVWVTNEAYSSPSIVLISGSGANRHVLDDFREAYHWLHHNTKTDAKIMSWWDYGYQITGMGNRTIIVDNNTWNNTHIATVGAWT
ncbi:uncharacterized protein HaLaN_04691 [Haematococcus lacustris]|uniref:dolichyl-diphosphooligosaccharide--protein glycotransferase n=1 Tax=Haematococcus lacustris TaxID=44745 RepID=A0A699YH55_HAELA|nr:uncharacterized protein HaLaN_04691 [Haematococcus lacustris]